MKIFYSILGCLIGFVLLIALGFALIGVNLFEYAFYGPKYQAVQRQIYVQTPSFILGNQAELEQQARLYRETSDQSSQETIKAGLQASVDNLPADFPVPADVRAILNTP